MIDAAQDIVPLRARRERLRQPIEAVAICKFQSKEISIQKVRTQIHLQSLGLEDQYSTSLQDEICTVRDNSNMLRWKVTNSRGQQGEVPGAVFVLRPPDSEAVDRAEKLKRYYDRLITLWQKKHLRMRQNMIFATIKVGSNISHLEIILHFSFSPAGGQELGLPAVPLHGQGAEDGHQARPQRGL